MKKHFAIEASGRLYHKGEPEVDEYGRLYGGYDWTSPIYGEGRIEAESEDEARAIARERVSDNFSPGDDWTVEITVKEYPWEEVEDLEPFKAEVAW